MKNRNLFRFGLIVLIVSSIFILVSCAGSSAPSGSNQATIDGSAGTSSGGIPVKCDNSTGSVHIPAGSFSGTETIKIECVDNAKAEELAQLVKEELGETNEILGAITLNPSPFDFYKDVTLTIPLMAQRKDLADTFQDLYVYSPNESNQLTLVNQASIASDGWSGTANANHFSTFLIVGSSASAPFSGNAPSFGYTISVPSGFTSYISDSSNPNTAGSGVGITQCRMAWDDFIGFDGNNQQGNGMCALGAWRKSAERWKVEGWIFDRFVNVISVSVLKGKDMNTETFYNLLTQSESPDIEKDVNVSGESAKIAISHGSEFKGLVCSTGELFVVQEDRMWWVTYHSDCVTSAEAEEYFKIFDVDAEKVLRSFELR